MSTSKPSSLLSTEGTQSPATSLGIVGPAVGAVTGVASFILANWDVISQTAGSAWTLGSLVFAAATGIWGRWRATRKISTPGVLKP
jgi:hypothetical protein